MKDINLLIKNGINVKRGIELLGDIEAYDEMLEYFSSEAEKRMLRINLFREQKDMQNYAILVHSLKSDSKYFGFDKLAELAYQHEQESKKGNSDFVNDNFEELNREFNRIVGLVKEYRGS